MLCFLLLGGKKQPFKLMDWKSNKWQMLFSRFDCSLQIQIQARMSTNNTKRDWVANRAPLQPQPLCSSTNKSSWNGSFSSDQTQRRGLDKWHKGNLTPTQCCDRSCGQFIAQGGGSPNTRCASSSPSHTHTQLSITFNSARLEKKGENEISVKATTSTDAERKSFKS